MNETIERRHATFMRADHVTSCDLKPQRKTSLKLVALI